MRTITLQPLRAFEVSVEAEAISPRRFASLTLGQIRTQEVFMGNRKMKLADLFKVEGDEPPATPEETTVVPEGDFSKVKRIGECMSAGTLEVRGNVGMRAGSGMNGGLMAIRGNAGAYLGEHMCAGIIRVKGDAWDFPGAVNQGGTIFIGGDTYLPGAEMTNGFIMVRGKATMLPSYRKAEVVTLEGVQYQKYVGDLVENGTGELYAATSSP
jgi:formylmethanofuran dehydrogenase subunit C